MTIVWQQCYDHRWCVHLPHPINSDRCVSIHACLRFISENGLFIELELNGITRRWPLSDETIKLPVGPFQLEVMVANLLVSPVHHDVSLDFSVDACVDTSIAGIPIKECAHIYGAHVMIHRLTRDELKQVGSVSDELNATYTRELTWAEISEVQETTSP